MLLVRRARGSITRWRSGNRRLRSRRALSSMSAMIWSSRSRRAPRDGGAMVTFTACPFTADYPEQREGQPPTSKIKIGNVNRELIPKIRAALGVREYIQILYREYLDNDLTEPAYGPIEFELREMQMVGASL